MSNTLDRERLAAIVDSSDDGIVGKTLTGVITSWNPGASRIFGYTADEMIGSHISKLFPVERLPEEHHFLSEIAAGRRVEHFQTERVRKDGRLISVSVTLSPIRNAAGEIVGASKIVRDITALKATQEALAAATAAAAAHAERMNLALDAARLGDWSWDARTDAVTFSPRAAQIFGVSPGSRFTRDGMKALVHPEDRDRTWQAVDEAIRSRQDYLVEYRLINGRERWVYASGRARYDGDAVLGMFGVIQDITEDRLLIHLEDAVRPLVDPDEITSTAAGLLGAHLKVHRCAYAVVDEDEDTFVITGNYTDGVPSIVGRYRFREFGAECLRLMREGQPYVVTDSATDPRIDAGDRRAYELTAIRAVICVPIRKRRRLIAAMAVHMSAPRAWSPRAVELVQRVASRCWESIERARIERDRASLLESAEAANRAKDEFLAMLGHELRNPLSPILTALQLMKLRGSDSSEKERTVIERQVQHLTRLVDDLLDVSRIARGKVTLRREVLELASVVASAIEIARPLVEQRQQSLTVQVPTTGLLVDGDAARLSQVVSNLLTNAAKYTPAGGQITVSASRDDRELVLRVRDTGIGISTEVLPRVFDLFVQGRQALDRAEGGLGLGLTIVRSLVEIHGGSVSVTSDGAGTGSEFVVRLPAALARRAADPPSKKTRPDVRMDGVRARVLIVDDNEDSADLLAEALRMMGHDARVAHDGPTALALASAEPFDAAFLDIGLPGMDGFELATRLRALPGLEHLRLVAVTGYGQESDHRRSRAAGFRHHLVKPVDLAALEAVIPAGSFPF